MGPRSGWLSPRSVIKATGPKTELRFSRRSFTTLGTDNADIQIFLRAHNARNLAEYEGRMEIDEKLLAELIRCTKKLEAALRRLAPPAAE